MPCSPRAGETEAWRVQDRSSAHSMHTFLLILHTFFLFAPHTPACLAHSVHTLWLSHTPSLQCAHSCLHTLLPCTQCAHTPDSAPTVRSCWDPTARLAVALSELCKRLPRPIHSTLRLAVCAGVDTWQFGTFYDFTGLYGGGWQRGSPLRWLLTGCSQVSSCLQPQLLVFGVPTGHQSPIPQRRQTETQRRKLTGPRSHRLGRAITGFVRSAKHNRPRACPL